MFSFVEASDESFSMTESSADEGVEKFNTDVEVASASHLCGRVDSGGWDTRRLT